MTDNKNYEFLREQMPKARIIALQGGTRSGKTYSALRRLIHFGVKWSGATISIVRETMPSLRSTAMRDFFEILSNAGLYDEAQHQKTLSEYTLNNNLYEFFSTDEEHKVRGRKRDILFCNEVTGIDYQTWQQLLFRTSGVIIADYNPTMPPQHWFRQTVLPRNDCVVCYSTYKDNQFLSAEQVREIERLQETDPEAWKVYGLGEWGHVHGMIYPNWQTINEWPDCDSSVYALDFGHNDPTALLEFGKFPLGFVAKELVYLRYLDAGQIIDEVLKAIPSEKRHKPVYCDHRPELIALLRRNGINAVEAKKGNAKFGKPEHIQCLKKEPVFMLASSFNLITEQSGYQWKELKAKGMIVDADTRKDEPMDGNDHLMDAALYAYMSHYYTPPLRKKTDMMIEGDSFGVESQYSQF